MELVINDMNPPSHKHFDYSGEFKLDMFGVVDKVYFIVFYFVLLPNKVPQFRLKRYIGLEYIELPCGKCC